MDTLHHPDHEVTRSVSACLLCLLLSSVPSLVQRVICLKTSLPCCSFQLWVLLGRTGAAVLSFKKREGLFCSRTEIFVPFTNAQKASICKSKACATLALLSGLGHVLPKSRFRIHGTFPRSCRSAWECVTGRVRFCGGHPHIISCPGLRVQLQS